MRASKLRCPHVFSLFYCYGSTASSHHQHTAAAAYRFVIKIHPYHSIGSQHTRLFLHLAKSSILCLAEHLLVRTAAPAHYIADAGKEITKNIGTDNSLTADDTKLTGDAATLNDGSCCY